MHLFNKENIWSNPCSPLHTFNHPDKYKNNNSVNRIISKEKEREEIQRKILQDTSRTSFQLESKNVSSVSTRSPVTTTTRLVLHTELILPQEIPKKYKNCKTLPVQIIRRQPSSNCSPRIQAFYTAESSSKAPTAQADSQ